MKTRVIMLTMSSTEQDIFKTKEVGMVRFRGGGFYKKDGHGHGGVYYAITGGMGPGSCN